ncbi:hypothetical protein [Streptomyces lushanensis]|uniref:hypothetical protein n=1 Tax=Streptomyces lushanensis TaxID=1434255 RepID=UPI0008350D68|nr:hypothetical protein [Streptomyces lushanensis]
MSFTVGDRVTVVDPGKYRWARGRTGTVVYIQTDGSLLVDGLGSGFLDALCGWPDFRPDQLQPA